MLAPFGVAFGLLLLWVVSLGFTQVQLVDAAREAARLVARGESVHGMRPTSPGGTPLPAPTVRCPSTTDCHREGVGAVAAAVAGPSPRRSAARWRRRRCRPTRRRDRRERGSVTVHALWVATVLCVRRRSSCAGGDPGAAQASGRVRRRPRRARGQPGQPGRPGRMRGGPDGGQSQRRRLVRCRMDLDVATVTARRAHRRGGATGGRSRSTPGPRRTSTRRVGASASRASSSCDGAGLVERLVAVAALGRVHARRAAVGALAGDDRLPGHPQPASGDVVAAFGEPGPAGVAVVHEHRQPAGVGVQCGRDAADVPPVAGREQWQHADRGVLGSVGGTGHVGRRQGVRHARCRASSTTPPWYAASAPAGRAAPRRGSSPVALRFRYDITWLTTSTVPKLISASPHTCALGLGDADLGHGAGLVE